MKKRKKYLVAGVISLVLSACSTAPEGRAERVIIAKVADPSGSYCHLKFPAIKKETLYSGRPVLTDPSEGDIIDFYGRCDHDPLGREEVLRQRRQFEFERHLGFDDE